LFGKFNHLAHRDSHAAKKGGASLRAELNTGRNKGMSEIKKETNTEGVRLQTFQIKPIRLGHIIRYDDVKAIGIIFSDRERFFFHRDRIMKGKLIPEVGDQVRFRVALATPAPGKFPSAHSIEILEPTVTDVGAQTLAEPVTQPVDGQKADPKAGE
jgi:hypothetical protein